MAWLLPKLSAAALLACNQPKLDQDGDGFTELTGDCDDLDANVHPEAQEVCYNGIDDNCNGVQDEEGATSGRVWYVDLDGDGFGQGEITLNACEQPSGYAAEKWDCRDDEATIHPDAVEQCDAVDNDCDGEIDEASAEDALVWYPDGDGDGHGDETRGITACESPGAGWTTEGNDCADGDPLVSPDQTESCITPYDDDCDGLTDSPDAYGCTDWYADLDGDGHPGTAACLCEPAAPYTATEATDCDDADPAVYPGNLESDEGWTDRNCDGTVDRALSDASLRVALSDDPTTSDAAVRAVTWSSGDLDGDGLDDLVVATTTEGLGGQSLYIASGAQLDAQQSLHETATAQLETTTTGATGDRVLRDEAGFQPQIVDLDEDGLGDLVVMREVQTAEDAWAYEASVFLGPVSGPLTLATADTHLQVSKSGNSATSRNLRAAGEWSDGRSLLAVADTYGGGSFSATRAGVVHLLGWDATAAGLEVVDEISGMNEYQYLGYEVADAGDLNGDGTNDRVVTTLTDLSSDPFGEAESRLGGVIELFTDETSVPETSVVSNAFYSDIVEHLGGPGDLNGDGHADLVFSASFSYMGEYDAGRVHVVWGPIPSGIVELFELPQLVVAGTTDYQRLECPAVIPDTDGDGRDDLAMGAEGVASETGALGATYVWLGEDQDATIEAGSGMATILDTQPESRQRHGYCSWQWSAVRGVGDVDGDGLGDLLLRGALDVADDGTETASLFLFLGGDL